jgi:hypothetical protein
MSVGGKVVEVVPVTSEKWWISTDDSKPPRPPNLCAVYVNPQGHVIAPGDSLWWHGHRCYWTPMDRPVGAFDIELPKIGYSGVARPRTPEREGKE